MSNNELKSYEVKLQSEMAKSFRCNKAANSLDIDVEKKSIHHLKIEADIESEFEVGLILGASGSGKTTLAKHIYGDGAFKVVLDENKPIIDQFDEKYSYDECASMLSGIGLTSVPCWIRPVKTLSNGQKARAEAALLMSRDKNIIVIDEWTSVVDRTVAKVMSHCVQKFARKQKKKIVLLSCHYDVVDWLNPDWIIDCNKQQFIDRRSLSQSERERKEKLNFTIKEVDRQTWRYFSKYHYLSEKLPVTYGVFGLFEGKNQIGFQCFANYVPQRKGQQVILHSNRTVIHPDYAGLGMGIQLINLTSKIVHDRGYKVMAKFSSTPVFKAMSKHACWKLKSIDREYKTKGGNSMNKKFMRLDVKMYSFEYCDISD